jgi:hypothetical protein
VSSQGGPPQGFLISTVIAHRGPSIAKRSITTKKMNCFIAISSKDSCSIGTNGILQVDQVINSGFFKGELSLNKYDVKINYLPIYDKLE